MKMIMPFNPMPDGTCRTIKCNYKNTSLANMIREGGGYAATGVVEYETDKD